MTQPDPTTEDDKMERALEGETVVTDLANLVRYVQDQETCPGRRIRIMIDYDYNHDRVMLEGTRHDDGTVKYTLTLTSWAESREPVSGV
jgi:hypothetical protein